MTLTQQIRSLKNRATAMAATPENVAQALLTLAGICEALVLRIDKECPLCGCKVHAGSSPAGISYLYCTNPTCDYSEKRSRNGD